MRVWDVQREAAKTMKSIVRTSLRLVALLVAPLAVAETHTINQQDKTFSAEEITIKVGDTITFPNSDPYFHNVFSLSMTKFFDLGTYGQGESPSVTFDAPGTVEVERAIHPDMYLVIEVTP